MPITKSALKALRQSKRKAASNRPIRSRVKTTMDDAKKNMTPESLASAFSAIDKALKKNILHRNKAARLKSKVSKFLASK